MHQVKSLPLEDPESLVSEKKDDNDNHNDTKTCIVLVTVLGWIGYLVIFYFKVDLFAENGCCGCDPLVLLFAFFIVGGCMMVTPITTIPALVFILRWTYKASIRKLTRVLCESKLKHITSI